MNQKYRELTGNYNNAIYCRCYAIVKNIANEIFFARVQIKGKVIEILPIKKNEAVKLKLLIGYELYLDTKTRKKAKASIDYEKISYK